MLNMLRDLWRHSRFELAPNRAAGEPPVFVYLLLILFTISYFTALGTRIEFLGAIRHELLLGFILLALCLGFVTSRPLPAAPNGPTLIGIALFFLVLLTQVPYAPSPAGAWRVFVDTVFKHAIYCFFVFALTRTPRLVLGVAAAWIFSMFWVYQESVRGLISGSLMWYNQGILRLHGSVPLYRHPNGLSLAACSCLPYITQLVPALRGKRLLQLGLLATGGLAGICVLYTGSRAGYVGLLALLPYWILTRPRKMRNLIIMVAAMALVVVVMPAQYRGRFESITGQEVEGHSREARLRIMSDAWAVFKMYPFGVGIDGFPIIRAQMFGRDQDTHNLYLQILTHIGIQGMAVWTFLVVSLFRSLTASIKRLAKVRALVWRAARAGDTAMRRRGAQYDRQLAALEAVAAGTRMYLFFLLVNGIFAHTLYLSGWWFITGLAISLGSISLDLYEQAGARWLSLQAAAEREEYAGAV